MLIKLQQIFPTYFQDNFELNALLHSVQRILSLYFTLYRVLEKALQTSRNCKGKSGLSCLGLYSCILHLQALCLFNYNDIFTTGEILFPSRFKSSNQGQKLHFRLKLQIQSLTCIFFQTRTEYTIPQIQVNLKSS